MGKGGRWQRALVPLPAYSRGVLASAMAQARESILRPPASGSWHIWLSHPPTMDSARGIFVPLPGLKGEGREEPGPEGRLE